MSFEIYLQCFEQGAPAGIPRNAVWQLFADVAAETDPDVWSVRYDDVNSCEVYVSRLQGRDELIDGLTVRRPCGDRSLWRALFEIMRMGSVVLYYPGGSSPLVAIETTPQMLPPDMVSALGRPLVIHSGDEIVDAIERG